MRQIIDRIYYVGVNDRTTPLFEGLWPLPYGVTYNSYVVRGDQAVALIDGVGEGEVDRLCHNIAEQIGTAAPDYLVVNHMEPDHAGGLALLHRIFPAMKIVGNAKTLEMARGYYGIPDESMLQVKDGDVLDLGGISLQFVLTPMVHWPETMMTYAREAKTLFTGDALGCYGALNGAVIDADMDAEIYIPEMYRYYATIVGKYGVFVQKALAKIAPLDVAYACPTHGPVWHQMLAQVLDIYDRLSRYEAEPGVTIVYGSMYGNTAMMAESIARRLAEDGVRHIRVHDASRSNLSMILADIFRYKGLVIGAPTYSNGLFPAVDALMQAIKTREIKHRSVAVFGSYTWGSQAVKRINAALEECKLIDADMPSVESKHSPSAEVLERCRNIADTMAKRVLG